ncbi:efflux transporter outer membrane subunit [Desulfopila sp. IMCC35008]|uniref:efflux transporter outer membrane subunit n=1 Tax=Desulfopila sp. IMCC35008 TaxID=2653858 RepID=UPI0013D232CF|nr:efflux transporter outer membrane subunit [Desulfopila sp. IMCC35008]
MIRYPILACTLLLPFLLSGCFSIGPEYKYPEAPVEENWIEMDSRKLDTDQQTTDRWWSDAFGDPELDQLVGMAFNENLTLRSAALRVLQAQQQLAIAIGSQFPQQQQATGSASRQKQTGLTFNDYSIGFNVGWEIDFWGRFQDQVDSASAALDASVASYDGILVSLVSQVAQNYVLIRTNQQRLNVARQNIVLQEESMRIAQAKFRAGEVSRLDLNQAESLLNNTKASVPALETSLQQLHNGLAILLGEPPANFTALLSKGQDIPETSATIAIGMPQDLLRRRPDIRLAERQLAAQSSQIGFAITELYPHLSIGGSIGTEAMNSGDLFTNDAQIWSLFGMFEWNIFNYGRLKSNVRLQDALFQQLLVDYRNTVLEAQGDVEDAIVAYLKSHEQLKYYRVAAKATQQAVDTATIQYKEGEITFNWLISILKDNLGQQDLLAEARGSTATNLIRVFKALGGGWEIRKQNNPVDMLPARTKAEMLERTGYWDGTLDSGDQDGTSQ